MGACTHAGFKLNGSAYKYTSATAFSYDVGNYDESGACAIAIGLQYWACNPPPPPHVVARCHASPCHQALCLPSPGLSLPHTCAHSCGLPPADLITYNSTTQGGINVTVTRREAMLHLSNITNELHALRLELEASGVGGGGQLGDRAVRKLQRKEENTKLDLAICSGISACSI